MDHLKRVSFDCSAGEGGRGLALNQEPTSQYTSLHPMQCLGSEYVGTNVGNRLFCRFSGDVPFFLPNSQPVVEKRLLHAAMKPVCPRHAALSPPPSYKF